MHFGVKLLGVMTITVGLVYAVLWIATALKGPSAPNSVQAPAQPTFKEGAIACQSATGFDQMTTAISRKDQTGYTYLLEHGCSQPRAGTEVSILDRPGLGRLHVRAYPPNGDAVEMWTYSEDVIGL